MQSVLYAGKDGIEFVDATTIKCGDVMRKFGITLILAGTSLIGALSLDVVKKNRSVLVVSRDIASKEVAFLRLFTTVGTVLVIAGVSATVFDKRP